jgi:hypothetical protein
MSFDFKVVKKKVNSFAGDLRTEILIRINYISCLEALFRVIKNPPVLA